MSSKTSPFMTRAHAKLNLALGVGSAIDAPGTQSHGYHPICSYMHAIELHDEIEIRAQEKGESSRFEIVWNDVDGATRPVEWDVEDDLVYRAHQALQARVGRELACAVSVRKSIPAGGGLGGGSSDCAAVLMGFEEIFCLGLGQQGLMETAMTLGSDIGFFIDNPSPPRPAIVSGFGEQIERVEPGHAGAEVTLILPPFGCATGEVYRAFDRSDGTDSRFAGRSGEIRDLVCCGSLDSQGLFNDLLEGAKAVQPVLGDLMGLLRERLGVPVHLTGSGSTLFVLGCVEAREIHEVSPDCRVVTTRLV